MKPPLAAEKLIEVRCQCGEPVDAPADAKEATCKACGHKNFIVS